MPQPCETIIVSAFRGDRSRSFASSFLKAILDGRNGQGNGPSSRDALLYAGHVSISFDGGQTYFGFHPDNKGKPNWQMLDELKQGNAFPGIVRDDTQDLQAARHHGLRTVSIKILFPDSSYQVLRNQLALQRGKCNYYYGFPNGDGDCNCITWLERIGLPLLTGRMEEFMNMPALIQSPSRRFGQCS